MTESKTLLDEGRIPLKASGTDSSRLGTEFVILDAPGSVVRGLNPTGARVWELIDGRRSVAEIASCVASEFGVPAERALHDVAPFVVKLAQKKLLRLDQPTPNSAGGK